jgi:hypothetical protein
VYNERLFTFLEEKGVEPTNNSVERALRTGVQCKIYFGNRSAAGERATARLLTVAETCDLQHRNILAIWLLRLPATAAIKLPPHYCLDNYPRELLQYVDKGHRASDAPLVQSGQPRNDKPQYRRQFRTKIHARMGSVVSSAPHVHHAAMASGTATGSVGT